MAQALSGRIEAAGFSEAAHVQLVDHRLFPGTAAPREVLPRIGSGVDDLARTVNVLRLVTGRRVRHRHAVGEDVSIARARGRAWRDQGMPTARFALERQGAVRAIEAQCQAYMLGRPQTKAPPAI